MPDEPSLADLVLVNDKNLADIDVSDLLQDAPLLAALPAEIASNGTTHKYLKETGAPVVGFRSPNDGREHDSSVDTLETLDLKILDATFTVDTAIANAYRLGPEAFIAREAQRHLRAAFKEAEDQVVNGDDAAGFDGFIDWLSSTAALTTNETDTGATAYSSVYLLKTGPNGVRMIVGQDGQLEIGETVTQRVAGATGWFMAYVTPIQAWLGVQMGGVYTAGRVCNISGGTGTTLDDALIYRNLELWEQGDPDLIVMSRRSREQLRASRTAVNATGAPAPTPTEVGGIPIITTTSVHNNEAEV